MATVTDINGITDGLLQRADILSAAALISSGEYRKAEALLQVLLKEAPEHLLLLDLYATCLARDGNYRGAEATWKKYLTLEPNNSRVQAHTAYLARIQKQPLLQYRHFLARGAAVLLLLLISASAAFLLPAKTSKTPEAAVNSTPKPVASNFQKRLRTIPGITVQATTYLGSEAVLVQFTAPLFLHGVRLSRTGYDVLRNIAQTSPLPVDGYSVVFVGLSDPTPIRRGSAFKDNLSLQLQRAEIAARIFMDGKPIESQGLVSITGSFLGLRKLQPTLPVTEERSVLLLFIKE